PHPGAVRSAAICGQCRQPETGWRSRQNPGLAQGSVDGKSEGRTEKQPAAGQNRYVSRPFHYVASPEHTTEQHRTSSTIKRGGGETGHIRVTRPWEPPAVVSMPTSPARKKHWPSSVPRFM